MLFSVFVLKQRRWWWLHLRCSKMLKPKFLIKKLSFWRWTNVYREVAACWTGWEGERRREVTPWQRQSGTGLSCAGVHLMCIDKGSKGPRLNRPGIISPGIRAPWQAAYTASCSSTSPTTLVSTCLDTSTCHRGGGQGGRCPSNVNSILQFTGAKRTQTFRSISKVQKPCFHRSTEKK